MNKVGTYTLPPNLSLFLLPRFLSKNLLSVNGCKYGILTSKNTSTMDVDHHFITVGEGQPNMVFLYPRSHFKLDLCQGVYAYLQQYIIIPIKFILRKN